MLLCCRLLTLLCLIYITAHGKVHFSIFTNSSHVKQYLGFKGFILSAFNIPAEADEYDRSPFDHFFYVSVSL